MYDITDVDTRSKENVKNHGEVFTPTPIVSQMLELIPATAWNDPEYVFIEPTCGNGQFLVKVFEKRLQCGISIEESLNTMIGMDITEENIYDSHKRLFELASAAMLNTGMNPNSSEWFVQAARIVAIVRNNIFLVDDSLKVLADYGNWMGVLAEKQFVFNDPTGGVPIGGDAMLFSIFDELSAAIDDESILSVFVEVTV